MTLLSGLMALFAGTTLAAGALATYYRWRWGQTETALKRLLDIGAEWRAFNTALRERAEKAERALAAQHAREHETDVATTEGLGSDAAAAADALNKLHDESARRRTDTGTQLRLITNPNLPEH